MVLRCYMPGCTSKGRFGFHKFPANCETCMKWQQLSKRRNLDTKKLPNSHFRLCEKHFKDEDYLRSCNSSRRLKKGAVLCLLIPEESSVYEEHSYIKLSISQQQVIYLRRPIRSIRLAVAYFEICTRLYS